MNPKFACDNATTATHPSGAPRYSDVSMRLFTQRDGAELEAARNFHITRADWSYIKDPAYIKQCKANGWTFQGTTNAVTTNPDHAMRNEDGSPVLDHFQRAGRYWSDCNNPAYRDWYVEQLKEWVALGADAIQRDEPTAQNHWDYEQTSAYYEDVHGRLRAAVGRDIPFSCNLAWNEGRRFGGKGDRVTRHFNFGMSELGDGDVTPEFITSAALDTRGKGKFIAYTSFEALDVPTYRRAIAGCYANGLLFIVPWDQFAGTSGQRVFSKPEDMADLYGFVRANAEFLDGYEAVEDADAMVTVERSRSTAHQEVRPPKTDPSTGRARLPPSRNAETYREQAAVHAWLRAKPGDRQAPLVLHLVDWMQFGPTQVRIDTASLFGGSEVKAELLLPTPYDAAVHAAAESCKDYSRLINRQVLTSESSGNMEILTLPDLSPWGMLILRAK